MKDNFFGKIFSAVKKEIRGGVLSGGIDITLAVLPAVILMPIIINSSAGENLFDTGLVLFVTGIGTLIYMFITRGRLPGYLGSSFAYIGISIYYVNYIKQIKPGEPVMPYLIGAYLLSAVMLFLLSMLCRIGKKGLTEKESMERVQRVIDKIIPPAVMGPAISLIGLELSPQAATQSGLANGLGSLDAKIALFTITLIIFLSVTRRSLLKNSSILVAVVISGIICALIGQWKFDSVLSAPIVSVPKFQLFLPRFTWNSVIMVIPPTLILFCEHIGRKIMIENLQRSVEKSSYKGEISLANSLLGNSAANAATALLSGVPTTLYAETIGVMRINSNSRPGQIFVAAIIIILMSFSGNLIALIQSMPDPIIGALSLFLMGIIAAPGVRLLVDKKVNYDKISNLLLTAFVLVAGLSKMSINIGATEIKGMSLGLLIGILLNLFFMLCRRVLILKEHLSFEELKSFIEEKGYKYDVFERKETHERVLLAYFSGEKFAEIVDNDKGISMFVKTDLTGEQCLDKFKCVRSHDGMVTVRVDGSLSDKEIFNIITNSRILHEKERLERELNQSSRNKQFFVIDAALSDSADAEIGLSLALSFKNADIKALIVPDAESRDKALKLTELSGRETDVYIGEGLDYCGEAPEMLVNKAKAYGDALTLLVMGPLTTLAKAITIDREAISKIGQIVICGGCFFSNSIEANILKDPRAAKTVLESGLNITCVGMDVAKSLALDSGSLEKIAQNKDASEIASYLSAVIQEEADSKGKPPVLCATAAAAYCFNPDVLKTDKIPVSVISEGEGRGLTINLSDSQNPGLLDTCSFVQAAKSADMRLLIHLIMSRLFNNTDLSQY